MPARKGRQGQKDGWGSKGCLFEVSRCCERLEMVTNELNLKANDEIGSLSQVDCELTLDLSHFQGRTQSENHTTTAEVVRHLN